MVSHDASLLGSGDDGTKQLSGRDSAFHLETIRDHRRGAQVTSEMSHHAFERARNEHDLVSDGQALVDQILGGRIE
jgi:hypothetical protein